MSELKDKVVIVTGAGRGIGASTARELARRGARVVVAARGEQADKIAAEIGAAGGEALAAACDVADHASVARLVETVVGRYGRVDAVINNAGTVEPIGPIAETDPEQWARALEVNLVGAYHLVRAALPHMLEAGGGTVVNLSSGAAFRPMEGWSAYCASKAGLAMLTRSIDHEYGARGIRAIGFSPGVVDTEMQVRIRASGINPVSRLPRETLAPPDDPAHVIAWLCTGAGSAYAGKDIDIREPALREAAGLSPLPA